MPPFSDGEAVLRARALLTLVEETPETYGDETICSIERGRPGSMAKPDYLRVYPNPADGKINIEYSISKSPEKVSCFGTHLANWSKS